MIYTNKKSNHNKKPKVKKTDPKVLQPGEYYLLYTIKKGDTLWDIAEKFPGVSVDDITNHNEGLNSNNLKLGNKIKIIQRD